MRRPRLYAGALTLDSLGAMPFLPFPDGEGGGAGGGGGAPGAAGEGGSGGATPPPTPAPSPAPAPADRGYPENTPPDQMTAEQQAAYWRHRSRQNEDRSREALAWKTANESKVADYDRLLSASQTEQEKAIAAATAKAAADGRAQLVPQLVAAEFLAAAKGALTREQVGDLLAPLDKSYFLDAEGNVDTAKVTDYVAKAAPTAAGGAGGNGGTGSRHFPDTGGGRRGGDGGGNASSVQAGRELYARMKKPQTTP